MAKLDFPALSGTMGDRRFYITVMTLQMVARFFEPTSNALLAEQRAQRPLNDRRVPEIAQYLLDKEDDWVFGSLTVSFDGESTYTSSGGGTLSLDPDTEFVVVDGQHRIAAIKKAILEDPLLKVQQIGVMLIPFESLDRNQQVFSDLNRTVQKTSRSLDILYDHADPLNGLVKAVASRVEIFHGRVEKNATSLAVRSSKFITLSSLYDACRQLLGGQVVVDSLRDDETALTSAEDFCVDYWTYLSTIIKPWKEVRQELIRPSEARIEYIAAHAVAFFALGACGAKVFGVKSKTDWPSSADVSIMEPLALVNWQKTNPEWQGIAMLGSAVVTRHQTRQALTNHLCHLIDPARFPRAAAVL